MSGARSEPHGAAGTGWLSLVALGVVFGDIGTSPLYASRVAVEAAGGPDEAVVLGIGSLIVWALVLSVAVKYISFVLRADNDGEGGVLALAALLDLTRRIDRRSRWLLLVAMAGAAALFGDAVITPAISVLSAVEGVRVALPALDHLVLPLTTAILLALFAFQRLGTERVGVSFGPVMLVWFVSLGTLGTLQIANEPHVLFALDPRYGLTLLTTSPGTASAVLAAVFLAITGGEALYADLGQVGRRGITLAWYGIAMPGLVLNYLGQGALLLSRPDAAADPFFELAPDLLRVPLLALATAATIIASQAVLTGLFSLARQAMLLGLLPPLKVTYSSQSNPHAIYIGSLNAVIAVLTIAVVLGFGSSERLASAYGLAVILAMVTTTVMFLVWYAKRSSRLALATVAGLLVGLDLTFLLPNLGKIVSGGWLPLTLAGIAFVVALAWHRGRRKRLMAEAREPQLAQIARRLQRPDHVALPKPIVFLARPGVSAPHALREVERLLGLNFTPLLVVTLWPTNRPRVMAEDAASVLKLGPHISHVHIRVGYMQRVDLPSLLAPTLRALGIRPRDAVYVTSLERVLVPRPTSPGRVLDIVYGLLTRLAERAPDRFHLPPNRTLEIGVPFIL